MYERMQAFSINGNLSMEMRMRWIELVDRWKAELSVRLGRSESEIASGSLVDSDFPSSGVRIRFEDGSDLSFRNAFYVGAVHRTPTGEGYISTCIAVFSANCGFHEFWIGPGDNIDDFVVDSGLERKKPVHELKGMFTAPADVCVSVDDMNPSRRKP